MASGFSRKMISGAELPPEGGATRSDDDVDLAALSDEELDLAWELWFDLAQSTSEANPPYTHGVFVTAPTPCDEAIRARGGSPPRPG